RFPEPRGRSVFPSAYGEAPPATGQLLHAVIRDRAELPRLLFEPRDLSLVVCGPHREVLAAARGELLQLRLHEGRELAGDGRIEEPDGAGHKPEAPAIPQLPVPLTNTSNSEAAIRIQLDVRGTAYAQESK